MADFAAFTPEAARELLSFMRQMKAMGFALKAGDTTVPNTNATPWYVSNSSGQEIPAYACMQATGTTTIGDRTFITVGQPADVSGAAGGFMFNGPRAIAAGGQGVGHAGPVVKALGDGSTATAGDAWGPAVGQWYIEPKADLTEGGHWFRMIGDDNVATDVVRVLTINNGEVVTVITDLRVDGVTVQKKTRDVIVIPTAAESGWTTWHTGESCPT